MLVIILCERNDLQNTQSDKVFILGTNLKASFSTDRKRINFWGSVMCFTK